MEKNYISLKSNYFQIITLSIISLIVSLSYSYLQYAVDGGLVLSNRINYPDNSSPMLYYFLNSWTSLHQVTQLLTNLNISIELSSQIILFSSTFFFSYGVFLLSNSIVQNVNLALLISLTSIIIGKNFGDTDYPSLIFSEHTYGMMSLAVVTFIFGLLANKNFFMSSFFTVILISIHPLVGTWILSLSIVNFYFSKFKKKQKFNIYTGAIIGLIFIILSFILFDSNIIDKLNYDKSLFSIYLNVWDGHRSVNGEIHYNYLIKTVFLLILSILYINKNKIDSSNFAVALLILSILASTILYLAFKIIPEIFPELIISLMPSRFIMLHTFIGWPLILSFIYYFINKKFFKFNNNISLLFFIFLFLVLVQNFKKINLIKNNVILNIMSPDNSLVLNYLKDLNYNNYILTSSNLAPIIFKKVKKPILLHTESMDFIPYHPYLVNSLFNILVKIYEVDIYSPPQQNNPSLPDFYVKKIFEKKETLNWEKIKKDFKIEYIIVPSDWSLKIKLINKDKRYKLYKIL